MTGARGMVHAIRVHETGGPEKLRWEEVEVGSPGQGQVRLRHRAVGVNYIDTYHRTGLYKPPLPRTMGVAGSADVVEVGLAVTGPRPAARVADIAPAERESGRAGTRG